MSSFRARGLPPGATKIYVGGLPRNFECQDLYDLFSHVGHVVECTLLKGYGFVHFSTPEEAQEALSRMNNYQLRPGWYISVRPSTTKLCPVPGVYGQEMCYFCLSTEHSYKECVRFKDEREKKERIRAARLAAREAQSKDGESKKDGEGQAMSKEKQEGEGASGSGKDREGASASGSGDRKNDRGGRERGKWHNDGGFRRRPYGARPAPYNQGSSGGFSPFGGNLSSYGGYGRQRADLAGSAPTISSSAAMALSRGPMMPPGIKPLEATLSAAFFQPSSQMSTSVPPPNFNAPPQMAPIPYNLPYPTGPSANYTQF